MKKLIYLFIVSISASCSESSRKPNADYIRMDIEIIPEDSEGGYSISWNDTLCSEFANDKLYYLEKRPNELHCYILNSTNDTLGYYIGLSSPRQWTYFNVTDKSDSIIFLRFQVGINHFSSFLADQSIEFINNFNEQNKEKIEFKPVKLDINSALRIKKEIELINAKN